MYEYKKLQNLVYHSTDYEHHTADVYLPLKGNNHPLVINVHGGAFQAGSKEMYSSWGPYLADRGIASMAVNYTLSSPNRASFPQITRDMDAAVNFAVKNASQWEINPLWMGFMGDSAGAYLGTAAACGNERSSAKIKFVICVYGVMDLLDWAQYTNATRTDFVMNKMLGQDSFTGRAALEKASPLNLIDEVVRSPLFKTKFFVLWGGQDEIVKPENQSLAFIKKLEQHNIPHEKYVVPEMGHFWFTNNSEDTSCDLPPLLKEDIAPRLVRFIESSV